MTIRIPAALAAIALSAMLSGCLTADPDAAAPDLAAVPEAACGPSGDAEAVPCPAETVAPAPEEAAPPPSAAAQAPTAGTAPAQPGRPRGRSAWNPG